MSPGSTRNRSGTAIRRAPFGETRRGEAVTAYTLANRNGIEAVVLDYGGIVTSLLVPDRNGAVADVTLGYDSIGPYETNPAYFGAIVGRYANRIARGRFTLDGHEYRLATNGGMHHLHGGVVGFDKALWVVTADADERGARLELEHVSEDGDEGYPGRVVMRVTYVLTPDDELVIDYAATTDRATHVNPSHHAYFNLAGHDAGDVLEHELTIEADRFLPVDETMIPLGEMRDVAATPFDFRSPHQIGARMAEDDEQLRIGRGYDHTFVLRGRGERVAARLVEPRSGRALEVRTTQPGMQLYTGNWLDSEPAGKGGARYRRASGVALETQHFPDSPNQPQFPSTVLRPGEELHSRTVYAFGVA